MSEGGPLITEELVRPQLDPETFAAEQQRINPWIQKLSNQGISLDIPSRFFRPNLPEQTHIDPLTGLPIDNDGIRIELAAKLSKAVHEGGSWAFMSTDADNLKGANTKHGRELGDVVILEGASRVTKAIDSLNLPPDIDIFATRQTGAADETLIWVFGADKGQLEQIKSGMHAAQAPKELGDIDFSFSTSVAMLTSETASTDSALGEKIAATKAFLEHNPTAIAFDLFNDIKQLADDEVKLIKIRKDIERIPSEKLLGASGREEVNKILVDLLGDTRVGKQTLEAVLEIQHFETIVELKNILGPEKFAEVAKQKNYSDRIVHAMQSENPRQVYYQSLLP